MGFLFYLSNAKKFLSRNKKVSIIFLVLCFLGIIFIWRYIFDLESKELLSSIEIYPPSITCIQFSPDGKTIAACGLRGKIHLLTCEGDKLISIPSFATTVSQKHRLSFSPDGNMIASGSDDPIINIWNWKNKNLMASLEYSKSYFSKITCVAFSPKGKILASTAMDKIIKIWDVTTRKVVASLIEPYETITTFIYSPDGKYLAASGKTSKVTIWDTSTLKVHSEFQVANDKIISMDFSPDSKTLAVTGNDYKIRLLDLTNKMQSIFREDDHYFSLAFSPDGKQLASVCNGYYIKLFDFESNKELLKLRTHDEYVAFIAFSPDGKRLASVDSSSFSISIIKLWDVSKLK